MAGDLLTGMMVGRYRLERRIAKGGMGSVWAARDERLERDVAIKLLPNALANDESAGPRFEREARAMGRLQHANVVSVFDVGTAGSESGDQVPYLVMELLHGRSLNIVLEDGALPPRRAAKILFQIALALAAAHRAGVVHRDLKPSNIMVADNEHVKVLDFGLARLMYGEGQVPEETLTTPGIVLGSCPYMSPEQALGDRVGPESDIYSFGSVAYELLSGRRAFEGKTPVQVMQAVARCSYPPLRQVAPEIPDVLAAVVDRCLQRDSAKRYQDANELARDLETILESEDSTMTRVPTILQRGSGVRAVAQARRGWIFRVIGAAASFLAIGLLAGHFLGSFKREPVRPDTGRWSFRELLEVNGALHGPTWHPNGLELVIEHHHGGTADILAVPVVDGPEPRVLIEGTVDKVPVWPAYSPDGAALAIVLMNGDELTLQVVPAVGGGPVAEVRNALLPSWLDSKTVLFSRITDGGSGIWSYRLDTGEEKLVLKPENDLMWWKAVVSSTGRVAALGGSSDISSGLFVGALGGGLRPWLDPGQRLDGFSWSSDGQSIVASVDSSLVWLDGDREMPLVPKVIPIEEPMLSPDGRALSAVNPSSSYDLVSVNPDGEGWSCIQCGARDKGWGSVSLDGAVAFRDSSGGSPEIVIREIDGNERPLTADGDDGSCPSFSPDGRRVAYLSNRPGGGRDLKVVSRAGGQPVTLAGDVEGPEYPSWSPDGRFLAYAAGTPIQVWVVSAAGGEPRLVTPEGGDYPEWSPDGRWLAYVIWTEDSDENQGAWVVEAAGGPARKIGEEPTRLIWSRDGRHLQQLRQSGDRLELWQCDPGVWQWSRKSVLDAGIRPTVHEPYRPLTTDPTTGNLVINRRSNADVLVLFEDLDPDRW